MFTGKKLSDYSFPAALDNVPAGNPRRIVNGKDGTDAKIAKNHRAFASALNVALWSLSATPPKPVEPAPPHPVAKPEPKPETPSVTPAGGWQALILSIIKALFGRK